MKITDYFNAYTPVQSLQHSEKLSSFVDCYTTADAFDFKSYDIFIVGVQEGRLSLGNETCAFAPDEIREELYDLYKGDWDLKILDLGNLILGNTVEDTYVALKDISEYFLEEQKQLIVLGGGHDLVKPIFDAYSVQNKPLSFASADAYLDFQDSENYNSKSFLSELVRTPGSLLSKYTLLAYQTYLCSPIEVNLLKKMEFNLVRLGDFNVDYSEVEPYLRDLDHLSIDLSVVKSSEAPANIYSSPNGITAEGLCVLLRYAGMSTKLKSVLFSELNPRLDKNQQSSKVFAQSIWYFIDGLHLRYDDFPEIITNNFKKFHVSAGFSELVFYKSNDSGRWWVTLLKNLNKSDISLLPCSLKDYNKAVQGVLSERISSQLKF
jgi:formiminoglutamase